MMVRQAGSGLIIHCWPGETGLLPVMACHLGPLLVL